MSAPTITIGAVLFLGMITVLSTFIVNQISSFSNEVKSTDSSANVIENELNLLSNNIENRIEKAVTTLENTSNLSDMREPLQLSLFSPVYKGIPQNADLNRRQIGQEILTKFPDDFVSFLFQMPNGSVYLVEPYGRQQNLSTYDLSHRDYYKGVIKSNGTFLGNVITSASSGRNQIQLAVPVFSLGDNKPTHSLIGVLSSGLNFKTFNEILQSLNSSSNGRIVLLDSNGTKIADSDTQQITSLHKSNLGDTSFRNLQSFKNAVKGKAGTVQEVVNGINTKVYYKPVKAIQNNWVLLLLQSSGAPPASANSSSSNPGNTTMNNYSNRTMLNSNVTNKSSGVNTTIPNQLPPESINGSRAAKI
jgi:cache domain-containing protein